MPSFFCPGGALWRLGKQSRHGGARPSPRQVSSRGTLAHPTPECVAVSPLSTGGVYMGPDKPKKNSSTRDKLADIRPPTEYYTDGNVFIGRGGIPPCNDTESDQKDLTEFLKSPGQESKDRYNDTLNPDGTLGSIVFFEETFVSSKLNCSLNANSPLREPNASRSLPKNDGNRTSNGTAASPAKRMSQITSNSVATSGNKRSTSHIKRRGHYSLNNIPSWVRQRRCLPTLDEVDIDKIDIISLNSLPVNDSLEQSSYNESRGNDTERNLKASSPSTTDTTKKLVSGPQKQTLATKIGTNNTHDKNVVPNGGLSEIISSQRPEESRSVLGDLTNNATKYLPSRGSKSAFYRFPRRGSASKKRSKLVKKANNGQIKSANKQITEGVDKVDEHTYVNLEYIANIMTESSGKDAHSNDDHTYDDLPVSARLKGPEVEPGSSQRSQGMRKVHTDSAMMSQIRTSRKDKDTIQNGRRKSDHISSRYSKLRTEAKGDLDRVAETYKPSFVHVQKTDCGVSEGKKKLLLDQVPIQKDTNRELSEIERRLVTERATPRNVKLDSVSSSETGTTSHSTEGDECAAILCSPVYSTKMQTKHLKSLPRNLRQMTLGEKDFLGDRSEKRNEVLAKHEINDHTNSVPFAKTRTLISNPRFAANLAKQARIVRTNSTEEGADDTECGNEIPVGQLEDIKKDHTQCASKPANLEFRRSLPVQSKNERLEQSDQPQRRSTTNVRAVEARLSQKQKRKIRRTIEGDEVLEALASQHEEVTPSVANEVGDEEVDRVQKIIQDWNERSQKLISRHNSTCYVGTHVHPVPPGSQKDQHVSQTTRTTETAKSHQLQSKGIGDSGWVTKDNANGLNKGNSSPPYSISRRPEHTCSHPGPLRSEKEVWTREDDWMTGQSSSKTSSMTTNNIQHLRPVGGKPSQVIEIYIAVQPHTPVERDECDVVHGEILVVNSAMQRENDWMWVYVPRTERFGYVPAFVARPMEFQYPQI